MKQMTMESLSDNAQGMRRVITRYANSMLAHHSTGPLTITHLRICILNHTVVFKAWQEAQETFNRDFEIVLHHRDRNGITGIILDSFVDVLSSLRYPKSIISLDSFLFQANHTNRIPSSYDLSYMAAQSQPEGIILFPALETIRIIKMWDHDDGRMALIRPFLMDRKDIAPVKTLCLDASRWPLTNLQLLDEFEGLCIFSEDERMQPLEYICGGMNYRAGQ
ncbi:hypothetical protein BJ912DRAFT_966072 [Pholiota molesta]|nr:hypothetical protein BJ912DRAFT_966072 [Pholiota molesta]